MFKFLFEPLPKMNRWWEETGKRIDVLRLHAKGCLGCKVVLEFCASLILLVRPRGCVLIFPDAL